MQNVRNIIKRALMMELDDMRSIARYWVSIEEEVLLTHPESSPEFLLAAQAKLYGIEPVANPPDALLNMDMDVDTDVPNHSNVIYL
jgi:hypothetical protein